MTAIRKSKESAPPTPTQLCFSLWGHGFLNATMVINATLYILSLPVASMLAYFKEHLSKDLRHGFFQLISTTLLMGVLSYFL